MVVKDEFYIESLEMYKTKYYKQNILFNNPKLNNLNGY